MPESSIPMLVRDLQAARTNKQLNQVLMRYDEALWAEGEWTPQQVEVVLGPLIELPKLSGQPMVDLMLSGQHTKLVTVLSCLLRAEHFRFMTDRTMELMRDKLPAFLARSFHYLTMKLPESVAETLRVHLTCIIGGSFNTNAFKDDMEFLKSIDKEGVLDLAYSMYFQQPTWLLDIPRSRIEMAGLCGDILVAVIRRTDPRAFENQAAYRAVAKYGTKAITDRCFQILNGPEYHIRNFPSKSLALIVHLQHVEALQVAFIEMGMHTVMVRRSWELLRIPDRDTGSGYTVSVTNLIESLFKTNPRLARKAVEDIVSREYILLIGRQLVNLLPTSNSQGFLVRWEGIASTCVANRSLMKDHVEPEWLHVRNSLVCWARCGESVEIQDARHARLKTWIEFGKMMGIAAEALVSEMVAYSDTDADDTLPELIGCTWLKCALFGEASPQTMLRCLGCRAAQYCSQQCQRRHWREGGHRITCGTSLSAKTFLNIDLVERALLEQSVAAQSAESSEVD